MKSSEYWRKRYEQLENAVHKKSIKAIEELNSVFDDALKEVNDNIAVWYQRIANNNQVSLKDAKKLLKDNELEEFHWNVLEYIKRGKENAINQKWIKELENASAKFHISKLEAQKIEIRQKIEELYNKEHDIVSSTIKDGYPEAYYHSCFEIEKAFMIGYPIMKLNDDMLNKIIYKPWTVDGKNFSDRIWNSKGQLIDSLHKELTRMYILGEAPDRAIENISKQFNTSKRQAGRLVQTEMSFFNSEANRNSYKELEVEEVEINGTLDTLTCGLCGSLDGQRVKLKDYETGVTVPPFHPQCRCTTVPASNYEFGVGERVARGEDGKTYYVPANMKYSEWKEKYLVDNPKFIGFKSKGNYSKPEIINIANQVKYMADKYIDIPSKWSGNIQINNELPSGKLWSCDITTRNNTSAHELLHEVLHSKSISYYDLKTYKQYRNIEEASVQLLTQEISKKEGIDIINSNYDKMVNILRNINNSSKIYETDYLFAKELFKQPVTDRIKWLSDKIGKNNELLKLLKELE